MVGGSAFVVVSERSADQVLFPRSGSVGDAVNTTTFPGGRRGHCISLKSGQGVDSRGGTGEDSDTSANWFLTAVTDDGRPHQTDTFLFPRIHSHNVLLSPNKF